MGKRVFITSDRIGSRNPELGSVLMKNFLYSIARGDNLPVAVMLMNDGVRLACEGSSSIEDLRILAEQGVAIRACGTCLDYLKLTDKLVVGEVSTMPLSAAALLGEDGIVTVG